MSDSVTPWIAALQASLSITNSRSSRRLMSIESVMPSSHLILCHPLLLLPPIPPSIRVFFNESSLCMRWPRTLILFIRVPSSWLNHSKASYPYTIKMGVRSSTSEFFWTGDTNILSLAHSFWGEVVYKSYLYSSICKAFFVSGFFQDFSFFIFLRLKWYAYL